MLNKKPLIIISILVGCLVNTFALGKDVNQKLPKLIFFHSPNCSHCIKMRQEFMPQVERICQNNTEIEYRDINEIENYKLFLALQEKYDKVKPRDLPVVFFKGKFLSGPQEVQKNLNSVLEDALGKTHHLKESDLGSVELLRYFLSFSPWAVISAGLIDGINPCAFTVIVFFISFLSLQGYRKRELIGIGLVFILAVFLTYFLIGLGLFGFLYRLKGFWLVAKTVNYVIGILSIMLGVIALHDFFTFKKTGESQSLILKLPASVRKQINAVIGLHYRVANADSKDGITQRPIFRLLVSAFITGFLISILEAVCTGQVYLPTIVFVLKTSPLKVHALIYLLLYNLMFVSPLFIIFVMALLGTTSAQFSGVLKKHLLFIKILMALLFFGLGIFLLWKA